MILAIYTFAAAVVFMFAAIAQLTSAVQDETDIDASIFIYGAWAAIGFVLTALFYLEEA